MLRSRDIILRVEDPVASVLVLQHAECESLGTIGGAVAAAGLTPRYVRTFAGDAVPSAPEEAAALIVMGGPMGVYEYERYPFLRDELRLIERSVAAGLPVLGVCLGSQLLATALGGTVTKGPRKEIGWYPVRLDDAAGGDPLFAGLPRDFMAFHWHGDVFTLPPGAAPLASSGLTPLQAFRFGENVYGFLFHLEVTEDSIRGMTQTFEDELREVGLSPAGIESLVPRHLPELQSCGARVFERWAALAAR